MVMVMIIMIIPWSAMSFMVSLLYIMMNMMSMGSLLAAILIVVVVVVMHHSWLIRFGASSRLWVLVWWYQIRIWSLRVLPWGQWCWHLVGILWCLIAKFRILHSPHWGPHLLS